MLELLMKVPHRRLKRDTTPESLDMLFGQNIDPNESLAEQLENLLSLYNIDNFEEFCLAFDAHAQHPGDGANVTAKDLKYDATRIIELRGMENDEKKKNLEAIIKEFDGLANKGVLRAALVPEGRNAIPMRIVLRVKTLADGSY
mmetsp:Transcript_16463/g.21476  ORF Transcript_16463/g.21476 Transcript_16463/m.21476 type:complete len:144 (-) Transcript_16463:1242-1673(-)